MRLICTFDDQGKALFFSQFLKQEGIENQLEILTNSDWGSPNYGDAICRIWVIEEDQRAKAYELLAEFESDPQDPRFRQAAPSLPPLTTDVINRKKNDASLPPRRNKGEPSPLTFYFLLICCFLFFIKEMTTPAFVEVPSNLPYAPLFSSPLYKAFIYDYPHAYEIIDKITASYGVESLATPDALPAPGKALLKEFFATPYWQGFYTEIISSFHQGTSLLKQSSAPLFEKIRQGEVWRLFTPCLLHSDLFHIFFNMVWLFVLGKQIEPRLGAGRYLLLITVTGLLSNTSQYLMGGPNFIGFSGVLSGMLLFVWARQRKAAWEGYQLESSSFQFIVIFIGAMLALQIVSFFLEVFSSSSLSPGIANTAHLVGGATGYLLGRSNFFAWKGTC